MGYISIERSGSTSIFFLSRPPVNAIDLDVLREAEDALAEIESDPGTSALVIAGDGPCFSAGLDLKAIPKYDQGEQREMIERINRVITALYGYAKPTIAAVNGHAIAGGFILAISCDYRIGAVGDYLVGVTEVIAGVPFPVATIEVLKAELPPGTARVMTLTGGLVGPAVALERSVLDEVVPSEALRDRALEMAGRMGALPPDGFAKIKRQLRGKVIGRIEEVAGAGDPLLDSWITPESRSGAEALLDRD